MTVAVGASLRAGTIGVASMTTEVSATWTGGIVKPDQAVPLADETRVRLTVEPIRDQAKTPVAAWESIQERLRKRPIHSGDLRFTRDELHERR